MKVEFVSYDGRYPCLCLGTLTIKIDDKPVTFGREGEYPRFWHSGGNVSFDENWNGNIEVGSWMFDFVNQFPAEYVDCYTHICQLFADNVEMGCCGGCL